MARSHPKIARRWSSIDASGPLKEVVHDTELVTAIKDNSELPSHKYDMARLERHAAGHEKDPAAEMHGLSVYEDELRSRLSKAVFVGHVNTDLDSVAGAMGAAALFGGTAALAEPLSKLNGEIVFALKNSGLEPPHFLDELPNSSTCDICLVDHTEEKQMTPSLRSSEKRETRIVGVIDHHALAKSFQTPKPIYMDIRPWGSMSTIVGYLFLSFRRFLPKPLAILLLQAILSDTLNLRSVTTTDADRSMVALLVSYAGIGKINMNEPSPINGAYQDTDIDLLAKKQFQAKTNWVVGLGAYEMVRGDQKDFAAGKWKFGISVLEVTDVEAVLKIAGEILFELRLLKKEKGLVNVEEEDDKMKLDRTMELDFSFLFVVNVVEETSTLLIAGGRELALAKAAFLESSDVNPDGKSVKIQAAYPGIRAPGSTITSEETAMKLPKGYVSRKAQFVPAFFKAIEDFEYEEIGLVPTSERAEEADTIGELEVQEKLSIGKRSQPPPRRKSSLRLMYKTNAMEMLIAREGINDDELIKVNDEKVMRERNGNFYDDLGKVYRIYETGEED